MSFRINTNTQAALALSSLQNTTGEIGQRQLRLSTGSRINQAADDSAGFTISNKLTAVTRGQAQALSNIGDAKSMLTVAEGALGTTMDILQTMKEKAVQAGNSSMGIEERSAIQSQIDELTKEVGDIFASADFNGTDLFSDSADVDLTFQVGDASGDTFGASIDQMGVSTLGIGTVASADVAAVTANVNGATATDNTAGNGSDFQDADITVTGTYTGSSDYSALEFTVANSGAELTYDVGNGTETISANGSGNFEFQGIEIALTDEGDTDSFTLDFTAAKDEVKAGDIQGGLNVKTNSGVASALSTIDSAINKVNTVAQGLGDAQNRLDFKSQNLETSMNNYEAANSRIADADFAKEQMEIVKLQILQQTGSAMFAQSNAAPQSVLSFF